MMLTQIEDLNFASQKDGNPIVRKHSDVSTRRVGEIARDALIAEVQVIRRLEC
jgi:hypothetical protein